MKQCPFCHKDIPEDAKVCPYCGKLQRGYQPMKRTPKSSKSIFWLIAFFFIFAPMICFSLLVDSNELDESNEDISSTSIGEYQDSSNDQVEYQYDSLSSFKKNVTNSAKYVSLIESKESKLNELYSKIDKEYLFSVTKNNNVIINADYTIEDNNTNINIDYNYDLSNTNNCTITYQLNDLLLDDINNLDVTSLKSIINVFDNDNSFKLLNNNLNEFNEYIASKDLSNISHYGIGKSTSKGNKTSSIRLFKDNNNYKVKITYKTLIK